MKDKFHEQSHSWFVDGVKKAPSWFVRAMVLMVAAFALAVVTNANAAPEAKWHTRVIKDTNLNGTPIVLRLFNRKCKDAAALKHVKDMVREQFRKDVKAGRLTWDGKDYESCWIMFEGNVLNIDSSGDVFNFPRGVPFELFKDDTV